MSPPFSALANESRLPRRFSVMAELLRRLSRNWKGEGVIVRLPNGHALTVGLGTAGAAVDVHRYDFIRRVMASGDIGLAESYVAGDWDTPDLPRLLAILAENFEVLEGLSLGGPIRVLFNRLTNLTRRNTLRGSKRNIEAHYDLGNDFYAAWLDPGMTYSSALFAHERQDLETAQREKYAALARAIDLQPGHTVLEIGCGWGGFAAFAAKETGAHVTGLNISPAQHAFARERMNREGLSERVDIRLCDYREAMGTYDRVVSIEMFEAVGERYWPTFFRAVRDRLKPGGKAGLQIITIRDDLFDEYRRRVDFIQKYVFPGGMLPNEPRLREESARADLNWMQAGRFGADYARTLAAWADRFEAAGPALRRQGFDKGFLRLWRFYLAYCEAGFSTGRTNVVHAVLS